MDLGHGILIALLAIAVLGFIGINSMLYECEKDLPRSQNCKIIAVPKNKEQK